MVIRTVVLIIILTVVLSANDEKPADPCETELIAKVEKDGLKSIRFFQLPKYLWQARKCQAARKSNLISRMENKQLDSDFNESKNLSGCTSSCVYIAVVSVVYFYASQSLKK